MLCLVESGLYEMCHENGYLQLLNMIINRVMINWFMINVIDQKFKFIFFLIQKYKWCFLSKFKKKKILLIHFNF